MKNQAPIPQEWIKSCVDSLLRIAKDLGPDSAMSAAVMLRADNMMDVLKAWQEEKPVQTKELSEDERHAIAHAEWMVSHATPDNPECCFDYELVQVLLSLIKNGRAAWPPMKK